MNGLAGNDLVLLADETARVDEVDSVQCLTARVTLVAACILKQINEWREIECKVILLTSAPQ